MSEIYRTLKASSTNVRVFRLRTKIVQVCLNCLWWLTPSLTRWIILKLFFRPLSRRTSKDAQKVMAKGRPFQIFVHGKRIQGWQWGDGPGVLMIHGWSGAGSQFHEFIAPLVRAGYRAITFDGPGHGVSQGRTSSYFEFSDTVSALLDADQGLDIQGIIAHSFGAAAAINGLVRRQLELDAVLIAPCLKLRELLFNTFGHFGVPAAIYQTIISEYENHYGYDLRKDNPHKLLKDLPGPVLMIHDQDDRVISIEDTKEISACHPYVMMHTTLGLGHGRILSDPEVIQVALGHLTKIKIKAVNF